MIKHRSNKLEAKKNKLSKKEYLKEKEDLIEDTKDIQSINRIFGLIAEDVEESGLTEYVQYGIDEETGKKEIEGIQYDRLVVPLIELAKEHDKRIQDLENQILELSK